MRVTALLCLGSILALGLATPSFACKGDKVLYEDDFQERDAAWSLTTAELTSGAASVGQGRLFLKAAAERSMPTLNLAFRLPPNADVCVTIRFVESENLDESSAGLIFWANEFIETNNFQIRGNGMYWVSRFADRTWQAITPTALAPGFRTGLGQDNRLRVLTKGQIVTLFVNDTQVARYRAPAPEKAVQFGIRATSQGKSATGVEFRDFKVTNVP